MFARNLAQRIARVLAQRPIERPEATDLLVSRPFSQKRASVPSDTGQRPDRGTLSDLGPGAVDSRWSNVSLSKKSGISCSSSQNWRANFIWHSGCYMARGGSFMTLEASFALGLTLLRVSRAASASPSNSITT